MNSNPHQPMDAAAHVDYGEETLRLIASLPVPQGLEDRVHKALRSAPQNGRVLAWPTGIRSRFSIESNWMRTAAAAAIVFVVVGGGWGVLSRVEQGQNGKIVVMPARIPASGGFAGAGAIRTPETIPGPTVKQPTKKAAAPKKNRSAQPAASQVAPQPVTR